MTEIMTIEDSFLLPGKGAVISGVNTLLDGESGERIKALVSSRVRITHEGDEAIFEVKEVGVSESIVGKKNISILLDCTDLAMLTRGRIVLTT